MKISEIIIAIVFSGLMTKAFSQDNQSFNTEVRSCVSEGEFNFSSNAFNVSINKDGYMALIEADSSVVFVPSEAFYGDEGGFDPNYLTVLIDDALASQSTMVYHSAGSYSLTVEGDKGLQAIVFMDADKEILNNSVFEFVMSGACSILEDKVLSVNGKERGGLSVYPTFVSDEVTVESEKATTVNIVNSNGESVLSDSFSGRLLVDVSSFSSGTYLVNMDVGSSTFIVQR